MDLPEGRWFAHQGHLSTPQTSMSLIPSEAAVMCPLGKLSGGQRTYPPNLGRACEHKCFCLHPQRSEEAVTQTEPKVLIYLTPFQSRKLKKNLQAIWMCIIVKLSLGTYKILLTNASFLEKTRSSLPQREVSHHRKRFLLHCLHHLTELVQSQWRLLLNYEVPSSCSIQKTIQGEGSFHRKINFWCMFNSENNSVRGIIL